MRETPGTCIVNFIFCATSFSTVKVVLLMIYVSLEISQAKSSGENLLVLWCTITPSNVSRMKSRFCNFMKGFELFIYHYFELKQDTVIQV